MLSTAASDRKTAGSRESAPEAASSAAPRREPPQVVFGNRAVLRAARGGVLRRSCSCGGTCSDCGKKEKLQRSAAPGAGAGSAPPIVRNVLHSPGSPLDGATRTDMESRFGEDFGNVRVHDDGLSAESAHAVGAAAYTVGSHVVFGAGRYAPQTPAGRKLLAHELAHVVQQSDSPDLQKKDELTIGEADDAFEREADSVAEAVTGGGKPGVTARGPQQRLSASRLQRITTTEFERDTLGGAIGAGTMTADASINGNTYIARNCDSCNISFYFGRAYTGDYHLAAIGRDVRGVYVRISAIPWGRCPRCNELRMIQYWRMTTESGGSLVTDRPDSPTREARAGWGDPAAPSRGWGVDRVETATDPYYSRGPFGRRTSRHVSIWDAPGHFTTATNQGREFHTCAVCSPATGASTILGCVTWGYYIDSTGSVSFRPATPSASCGAGTIEEDATTRWEGIAGNDPANIDFP